jgi:hypothetical protein
MLSQELKIHHMDIIMLGFNKLGNSLVVGALSCPNKFHARL